MEGSSSRQQPIQHPTRPNIPNNTVGISVGGNQTVHGNVNNYVNTSPSSSQASATRKSSFRCNLPLPTQHYQGREDILDKIFNHFTYMSTQPINSWRRMVAIVGMGGIGKSETACKFANKYRGNYPCAAWINAETEEGALDSFMSLAKSLEIVSENQQRADLELVKKVYRHIDADYLDPVLLIFDNAIQLQSREKDFGIFDFLPTEDLSNQRFPYIIITSQRPGWHKDITTFKLEELSREESLSFFRSTFKISSSGCDEAFKKLHIQLQGYPLAMTLASSNIDFESDKHSFKWLQQEIELFIEKFEKEDSSILTQKINKNWTGKYNKTLSTVWQLSFKRLQAESTGAGALMLLQAISFFHVPVKTQDLRLVFIECPYCPGTPDWMKNDRLNESIRLLQKFHLVDCSFNDLDYSGQLKALQSNAENNSEDLSRKFEEEVKSAKSFVCEFRVHRLVQLVVRMDMDCNVVLEDILRFLAFWAKVNYVRQLNVSAVEEAIGRARLSTRAVSLVGLLALQGNRSARRFVQTTTAPDDDPAATIWRLLQLDKSIQTLNQEAIKVLRAFIGLSSSLKSLIDKRCFAQMALEMFGKRRIFPYVRDDRTSAPGICLQSLTETEGIACELFSIGCSFTDVCSLPLLCRNPCRSNAAALTVLVGNIIIEDLTKAKKTESQIAKIREELNTYREFVNCGNNKWSLYREEMREIIYSIDSWQKFESEVGSCGLDQVQLKQVFSSIFDKIWSATDKKNFGERGRLGHAFKDLDYATYAFVLTPRSREILIPLMDSSIEFLAMTEAEQLSVLQNSEAKLNNAVIWICSTWMTLCIQKDWLSSNDLSDCLSRVRILTEMKKIPIDKIRDALQSFGFWKNLKRRHETTFKNFMEMYSESSVEEIRTLVTFCSEIQQEMSMAVKQLGYLRPEVEYKMSSLLDKLWEEVCGELKVSDDVSSRWLKLIKFTYEPRICYNLPFLELKLKYFQQYKHLLKCPHQVFFALIFQTMYYDTKSTDNSGKCIDSFNQFVEESGIAKNEDLVRNVKELIEVSVTNSTEAHVTKDLFGQEDQHYFLDMNFVIWASDWDDYSQFSGKTRSEYDFLNDTAYTSLRLKVLQSLLQIPNLFATKEFRSELEAKARDNISKEINSLK